MSDEPMRAVLTDRYFSDPAWLYERKLDGERLLGYREGSAVTLRSRSGRTLNDTYPEIVAALAAQDLTDFVIDGEVVAFAHGRTSFERLQQRIGITDRAKAAASGVPVYFYVFDLLRRDREDVTGLPLRKRKQLLRQSIRFSDPLRYTTHRNEYGEAFLEQACGWGWEGLIAKRADAPYVHRRSPDWLKFKCVAEQEFVIGGFTDPAGSRAGFGALLVGYYENGSGRSNATASATATAPRTATARERTTAQGTAVLRYAGKVGTGYNEAVLRELRARMDRLEQSGSAFATPVRERGAHWIMPDLVAQIGFTEWTRDGKLRHPRFLGLRTDKDPRDVIREVPQAVRR